jgi:4-diphosphocytidyl-2-C-methyl-D-erythritol kinase
MKVTLPSFAKINLGLRIGALRPDGFHELRTVYQTIALRDTISVSAGHGSGIEIRCNDPRVPTDTSNTCYKVIERALQAFKTRLRVVIEIKKQLPVRGGLGGASGNAMTALLGSEIALQKSLSAAEKLRIAAEVGSDLPLFFIGGTVLGVGRGEEVYPLPDFDAVPCVIALPEIAVSTPEAFAEWDKSCGAGTLPRGDRSTPKKQVPRLGRSFANHPPPPPSMPMGGNEISSERETRAKLTARTHSDRMLEFSREISAWLSAAKGTEVRRRAGVSAKSGGRAENPLLDLVRTGIENDFEKVVFPQHPELSEVKRVLERAGSRYASLSGSGSTIYGLFDSRENARAAAKKLNDSGMRAVVTTTLSRRQYWTKLLAISS